MLSFIIWKSCEEKSISAVLNNLTAGAHLLRRFLQFARLFSHLKILINGCLPGGVNRHTCAEVADGIA